MITKKVIFLLIFLFTLCSCNPSRTRIYTICDTLKIKDEKLSVTLFQADIQNKDSSFTSLVLEYSIIIEENCVISFDNSVLIVKIDDTYFSNVDENIEKNSVSVKKSVLS